MTSSFSKRRSALLSIREKAIGDSTPNPAQAIDKASLNAALASSEEATDATPPIDAPVKISDAPINKIDKGKGKKTVSSVPRGKGSLEETEVEVPRKRLTEGPRLSTVDELDETLAIIQRTPDSSRGQGSSTVRFADHPWTQEDFKVPDSKRDLFKLSQEIQKPLRR